MKSAPPPSAIPQPTRAATRLLASFLFLYGQFLCGLLFCGPPAIAQDPFAGFSQQDLQNRIQEIQRQASALPDPSQIVIEHIHGMVINAVDKKAVARVLVSSADQRMATMTDYEGKFSFDVQHILPNPSSSSNGLSSSLVGPRALGRSMTTYLMARRPGYLQKQAQVRLSSDPQVPTGDIVIKIVPEAVIRGHLSMANGTEPARIQVQLRRKQVQDGTAMWVQAGGVQANSRGAFSFADLRAGDYKIMTAAWTDRGPGGQTASAESSGFAPAYYGDSADLASSPVIHLNAGDTFEANLSLRAATFYHVAIPTPNLPKGVGANVTVGNQDEGTGLSLRLNQQTQTIEGFLPNGAYDIRVFTSGPTQSSGRGRVEIAGKPVKGTPIPLLPTGKIPVIVSQEYTSNQAADTNQVRAVSGLQQQGSGFQQQMPQRLLLISLHPLGSQGPGANMTSQGDQGLVLNNVNEGVYRVVASSTHGYIASMTANGVDLLRQPLTVGPGGASGPIQVTLRDDAATLTGSITTSSGATASLDFDPIIILCIPVGGSLTPPAFQGGASSGKFTVSNLRPGDYLVLAFRASSSAPLTDFEYQNPDVLRDYQAKGTVVSLTAGQKADIRVPLLTDYDDEN